MADRVDRVGQRYGDYRLTRWLGGGSFGDVYLGEHIHDNTLAAVKVLQTRLTDKEELKDFINEARTFRLRHPHIVQLLDFGIGDGDIPFLIMDYAPNGTLRQRHPRGTQLPLATIVTYIKQAADALQYAHDRRLIHRDVKPENMLLGSNHEVLLSDFGIAVVAHSTHSLDTQSGGGTIPYMAPEQIRGKPRAASDQYALGIIVYEWLCGTRPFNGTATEIAMQHLFEPPPSLREKLPTIPPDVEQVVLIALAKDPQQRFASVQAFAQALTVASNQSQPSIPTPQQGETPVGADLSRPSPIYRPPAFGPNVSHPGAGPTPSNSPTPPPSPPANQTPTPPNDGYDNPVPAAPPPQTIDNPPSDVVPVQAHTPPQPISSLNAKDDVGPKDIQLSPPPVIPIPAVVPISAAGAVAKARTPKAGGIQAWRNIGNPRLFITLGSILFALLVIGSTIAYASPGNFSRFNLGNLLSGLIMPSATVTITPTSMHLSNTYTLFGVTGNPDPSLRQVQARQLTSTTPSQSKTAAATGTGHTPGVQASGRVTFENGEFVDRQVPAGITFTLPNGLQVVTDQAVDIPPANSSSGALGVASVPAHVTSGGTSGNIAAFTINQTCCGSGSIYAKNLDAFTGGQDPKTFYVVQQSDIDGVANPLKTMLLSTAQQSLQSQMQPNERFTNPPQCTPKVTSDHTAGDAASSVTVTVKATCAGEVYDQQGVQTIAANLLKKQAATTPGAGYTLVGNLVTGITQVTPTGSNKGTLEISVKAEGIWVFQFSDAQKQALARLIAGKNKQDAQTLLLQQIGVTRADIQLNGGDGKTLPTDPTQITIVVLNVPGLKATPMTTPTVGPTSGPGTPTAPIAPPTSPTATPTVGLGG